MSFRRRTLEPFLQTIRKGFQYLCIVAYFWPWSYKTAVRHYLKVGSLYTLIISTSKLLIELLMEFVGTARLHKLLSPDHVENLEGNFKYFSPVEHYLLPGFFVAAVMYLLWHHYTEIKKPAYEFAFLSQLNRFMRDREAAENEEDLICGALRVFHRVFENSHIERCSIYTVTNEGLVIPDSYIYPDNAQGYQIGLNIGEGVAGLVFNDARPRYVPRLLFPFATVRGLLPSAPFPHAVKYEARVNGDTLELVNEDLDFYAFKNDYKAEPLFRSFVSVPLKPAGVAQCFGVLNFDFSKVDALDKSGIAMASVLGKVLANEVNRLRNRHPSENAIQGGDYQEVSQIGNSEASPRLGPRLIRMSGKLDQSHGPEKAPAEIHTNHEPGFSTHLNWTKMKVGWSGFKQKTARFRDASKLL